MNLLAVWINVGSKTGLFESELLVTPILKPYSMKANDSCWQLLKANYRWWKLMKARTWSWQPDSWQLTAYKATDSWQTCCSRRWCDSLCSAGWPPPHTGHRRTAPPPCPPPCCPPPSPHRRRRAARPPCHPSWGAGVQLCWTCLKYFISYNEIISKSSPKTTKNYKYCCCRFCCCSCHHHQGIL